MSLGDFVQGALGSFDAGGGQTASLTGVTAGNTLVAFGIGLGVAPSDGVNTWTLLSDGTTGVDKWIEDLAIATGVAAGSVTVGVGQQIYLAEFEGALVCSGKAYAFRTPPGQPDYDSGSVVCAGPVTVGVAGVLFNTINAPSGWTMVANPGGNGTYNWNGGYRYGAGTYQYTGTLSPNSFANGAEIFELVAAPSTPVGFRSLLAFWMGGASTVLHALPFRTTVGGKRSWR